jgi:hypothetical protein
MSRGARSLVGFGAGALLTAVGLAGLTGSRLPSGWAEQRLDLRGYCRSIGGAHSSAYQPTDTDAWRCGVWHNGVWALEPVNLDVVCEWQRGEGARLREVPPRDYESESEVLCAI